MTSVFNNNMDTMLKEYSDKITFEIVKICAQMHSFNAEETYKQIRNNNIPTSDIKETVSENRIEMPIKKKRGRPRKVKTDTVSNSYVTGKEDPVVKKLLTAMNIEIKKEAPLASTSVTDITVTDDELKPEPIIDDDDDDEGEIETTMLVHKGVEYLLDENNTVYENIGTNEIVGKWDAINETIISV